MENYLSFLTNILYNKFERKSNYYHLFPANRAAVKNPIKKDIGIIRNNQEALIISFLLFTFIL